MSKISESSRLVVSMQMSDHHTSSHVAFGVLVGSVHAFFSLPEGAVVFANNITVLIAESGNPSAVDTLRPLHIEIVSVKGGSGARTALLKLERGGTHTGPPRPIGVEGEALSRLKESGDIMATLASFGFNTLVDEVALQQMTSAASGSTGTDGETQSSRSANAAGAEHPLNRTLRDVGLQAPEQITGCYFSDSCGVNPDTPLPDPVDD